MPVAVNPFAPPFLRTSSVLTRADRLDHLLARLGVRRGRHRVEPGLWALGRPGPGTEVFVTGNYTLSFDALRAALAGRDAWILVLDTKGINVWCAAGGRHFSTEELVRRIGEAGLARAVGHRRLILPQLAAPGVSARVVAKITGFDVAFGPVRARDIPAYLDLGGATPDMRQVTFTLRERAVLIPVEAVHALPWLLGACLALWLAAGTAGALAAAAAFIAGLVLFPLLLPWLPTRDFSSKGFILGFLAAAPFAALPFLSGGGRAWWLVLASSLAALLSMAPVTAFLALNFTGSTPFTSKSGVRREIAAWVPVMAWTMAAGLALGITAIIFSLSGGN